jgi:hypothetical protein
MDAKFEEGTNFNYSRCTIIQNFYYSRKDGPRFQSPVSSHLHFQSPIPVFECSLHIESPKPCKYPKSLIPCFDPESLRSSIPGSSLSHQRIILLFKFKCTSDLIRPFELEVQLHILQSNFIFNQVLFGSSARHGKASKFLICSDLRLAESNAQQQS